MSNLISFSGELLPVATKEELLEFANKVREAGEGTFIDALMPSYAHMTDSCLIANALNFECKVDSYWKTESEESTCERNWYMFLGDRKDLALKIAEVIGSTASETDPDPLREPNRYPESRGWNVKLPQHIGNAAAAFDARLAFTEYRRAD